MINSNRLMCHTTTLSSSWSSTEARVSEILLSRFDLSFSNWEICAMHIGILEVGVRVGLVLATGLLFAIMFLTYRRAKGRKMLLITTGFGVFFVDGLISLPELVNETYAIAMTEEMHMLIQVIGLVFILIGILQE